MPRSCAPSAMIWIVGPNPHPPPTLVVRFGSTEVLRTPRSLIPFAMNRCSGYVPAVRRIVSPGLAASMASCTGVPGPGGTTNVVPRATVAASNAENASVEPRRVRIGISLKCLARELGRARAAVGDRPGPIDVVVLGHGRRHGLWRLEARLGAVI